jgi:hypothetical protein
MVKKAISRKTDRGSEQFQLRLPDGMRKRLADVAERQGHTMNAVIVTALAMYFQYSENQDVALRENQSIATDIKDLRDRLANLEQKLNEKADAGELVQLLKQAMQAIAT